MRRFCLLALVGSFVGCGGDAATPVVSLEVRPDGSVETTVEVSDDASAETAEDAREDAAEVVATPGSFRWDLAAIDEADFYAYPWPSALRTQANGAADLAAFTTSRALTSILADAVHAVETGPPGSRRWRRRTSGSRWSSMRRRCQGRCGWSTSIGWSASPRRSSGMVQVAVIGRPRRWRYTPTISSHPELGLEELDVGAAVAQFLGIDASVERWRLGHPVVATVIQPLLDAADPLHSARHLLREPLPGGVAHDLVMLEGFLDALTPPVSIEALASAIGLPIAAPVARPIAGLDAQSIAPVQLPASHHLPTTNGFAPTGALLQLPEEDHYIIYFNVPVRQQLVSFLASALAGEARLAPAAAP